MLRGTLPSGILFAGFCVVERPYVSGFVRVLLCECDEPFQERSLNICRMSGQHCGMLATSIAVLASRMYQNVQFGANGCVNE